MVSASSTATTSDDDPHNSGTAHMHLEAENKRTMVYNYAIAGASAGLVSSIASCPLDVIKTRLQAQRIARGAPGYMGVIGL